MKQHPRTPQWSALTWRAGLEAAAVLVLGAGGGLLLGGWSAAGADVGAAGAGGPTESGAVAASAHDGGALHWPAGPWVNAMIALVVFGAMLGLAQLRRRQGARPAAGDRETAGRR
jgi:hypothetical protein